MIRMFKRLFFLIICLLSFSSCEEDIMSIVKDFEHSDDERKLEIMRYNFSPDYKYIDVYIQQTEDLVTFVLNDTSRVKLDVSLGLHTIFGGENLKDTRLYSFEQVGSEYVDSLNMKMLVLADLTMPQEVIDKEYYAVREIRNLYTNKNLYISFITPKGITNSLPADDYLVDYSFIRKETGDKYLYRSISHLLDDLADSINVFSSSKFGTLLIMSDANVYNADSPIDPDNYEIQEELVEQVHSLSQKKNISIYYANYAHSEAISDPAAINLMKFICKRTNGVYTDKFDWPTMKSQILSRFKLDIPDYKIKLINADGTVFKGTDNLLELKFLNVKTDTLLVEAKKNIRVGNVFNPIIVNGRSPHVIILQGIVVVLLLLMITYIIFQYIIPFIRYRFFLRKYITQYTGNQMIFNEHPVAETCYYCKAPFEKGDEIVVKCQHVMHKECWEENNQHCPEYGRHCKDGSHYYNRENLSDPRNASFYLKWIVLSLIAGLIAWIIFTLHVRSFAANILEAFFQYIYNIEPTDEGYQQKLTDFSSNFRQLPSFGLCISFATTFLFSQLSVFRKKRVYFYTECFLRALLAGIGGWLAFIFVAMLYISLDINEESFLLSWMPWPVMGCVIALCVTWHTRIKFRRYWIWVSILLGLLSMGLWGFFYIDYILDFRGAVLISHLVFALGMGLCIAKEAPRSEHYFLHVEGAIKAMDIALYKWLSNNEKGSVVIGKSVDCDLQLSWDINSVIAPKQAEIRFHRGRPCLFTIEEGVYTDEEALPIGERMTLYHGTSFTIGRTIFTYLEKDV